jgi:hypothetical protein
VRVETVAEQLYFTTVRLTGTTGDQQATGTGFIYAVPSSAGVVNILVSNKHVFDGGLDNLEVSMIAGKDGAPHYGTPAVVDMPHLRGSVIEHPDANVDVAAIPLGPVLHHFTAQGIAPFFRAVTPQLGLTQAVLDELDAIEDVVFVGYPANLYDTANLTPILRRGSTATPVALDYQGQPAFLIDASVFPGSSGSPVFVLNRGSFSTRTGGLMAGTRVVFLGVLAAVHTRSVRAEVVPLPTRMGLAFADPLNLGIVFKASAIDSVADQLLQKHGLVRADGDAPSDAGPTAADEAVAQSAPE